MNTKHTISFVPSTTAIHNPVTKFGGQPVGLPVALWPKSRSTGNPMRFICQIALREVGFSDEVRLAYIFMTDEDEFVDGTYEADGGENAVIVRAVEPQTESVTDGPTLYVMTSVSGSSKLVPVPREFSVQLKKGTDPDPAFMRDEPEDLSENKIGGNPAFMQGDETPPGDYELLLQLDSTSVPFYVNFGDAGIAYVFISGDRTSGKFLWQCG